MKKLAPLQQAVYDVVKAQSKPQSAGDIHRLLPREMRGLRSNGVCVTCRTFVKRGVFKERRVRIGTSRRYYYLYSLAEGV